MAQDNLQNRLSYNKDGTPTEIRWELTDHRFFVITVEEFVFCALASKTEQQFRARLYNMGSFEDHSREDRKARSVGI